MELITLGSSAQKIEVADQVFSAKYNETLIHQVVVAQMASERSGTKAQKNRSAVRGGGAKPWRQKGTGRARAGTSRSPIWRSGGVTFAAQPRNYAQKVNRKMYQGAARSVLSELIRTERLVLVDDIKVEAKTKSGISKLKELDVSLSSSVLIVTHDWDEALYLAFRNLHRTDVIDTDWVSPLTLIAYDKVIMTAEAIKLVEARLV